MAFLTELPEDDARRLAVTYGLDLTGVQALAAGSVNSNFRIDTRDGRRLFGRIYEEQGLEGAKNEARLLRELSALGVPTSVPLARLDGQLVSEYRGKPFAVYPWLDGDLLCQARVTPHHCAEVGRALAAVHAASPRVSPLSGGRFRIEDLHARIEQIERTAPSDLVEGARQIRAKLGHYEAKRNAGLPQGVIHGDLFRDNVLWQGERLFALLDFESACYGPFAYDLTVTLLAWCYSDRFEPKLTEAMLRGYHRHRPISLEERRALVVEGAIGCLRFATTRITDFSMRAPPGKPPLREYRRMLARLAALESGALDTHLSALEG